MELAWIMIVIWVNALSPLSDCEVLKDRLNQFPGLAYPLCCLISPRWGPSSFSLTPKGSENTAAFFSYLQPAHSLLLISSINLFTRKSKIHECTPLKLLRALTVCSKNSFGPIIKKHGSCYGLGIVSPLNSLVSRLGPQYNDTGKWQEPWEAWWEVTPPSVNPGEDIIGGLPEWVRSWGSGLVPSKLYCKKRGV